MDGSAAGLIALSVTKSTLRPIITGGWKHIKIIHRTALKTRDQNYPHFLISETSRT
jgi:hypothetical protein